VDQVKIPCYILMKIWNQLAIFLVNQILLVTVLFLAHKVCKSESAREISQNSIEHIRTSCARYVHRITAVIANVYISVMVHLQ